MANGVTRLADLIVPAIFAPYVQQITQEKSRLVQSGVLVNDALLSSRLDGAGLTFNEPSFRDLDNDEENISQDDPSVHSSPNKISASTEIQVRLSRNNSWSSMDLAADLIGTDPLNAIANRVANYWVRRRQRAFIATVKGVFANDAKATDAYHTKDDMIVDISGSAYSAGVTDFNAAAMIDACTTMGDSMDELGAIMVHSVVYARMLKNNLITFIPPSLAPAVPNAAPPMGIPTFLGREVIVDDSLPSASGVFETWLMGRGSFRGAVGSPKTPVEVFRDPSAGKGSGQEILYSRVEWIIAPVGYAYKGTAPQGGPSNEATANNLANEDSWQRAFGERKQIKIAKLVTREH